MTKKVTSTIDIDFTTIGWAIGEGQIKELPDNEDAQKEILANEYIKEVSGDEHELSKSQQRRIAAQKETLENK